MDYGTPLSSYDSEMASKVQKISVPRLEINKMHCYYIKNQDDALFKNRSKRPAFLIRPLNYMLNSEVDRLYLQQIEFEMDRTDYPVDYNFLK